MADSSGEFVVRRRRPRGSPMRARHLGALLDPRVPATQPSIPFPGMRYEEEEGARRTLISGSIALLLHAGGVALLFLLAWLAPEEIKEELIPVSILQERPAEKTDPAPARKALAERRSVKFLQNAQAVKPQVVNPRVVARAVPQVAARKIEMNAVAQVAAPREVTRSAVVVEKVTAVHSAAAATADVVDIRAAGPALRGPVEVEAPVGAEVGPRQVARVGDTVGTGESVRLGDGSSVREGLLSDRDVLGSRTGERLTDVNTRVGDGYLRGSGGTGTGGVSIDDCFKRPEVQAYWEEIRNRMYARWTLPPEVRANQQVQLRFKLDPAGTASEIKLISSDDQKLGRSAVDALRSASPFPPMRDPVRCLAGLPIIGTFRNPVGSDRTTLAN